jgi:hypothetical protein
VLCSITCIICLLVATGSLTVSGAIQYISIVSLSVLSSCCMYRAYT